MATNGIFSGDMTDGNEGVIEEMEAQDDGVRSLPTTEQYECVRHKQVHFRSPGQDVCDTEVHCTFCDGAWRPIRSGGFPPECKTCTERSRRNSIRYHLPTEADFDALRASVPSPKGLFRHRRGGKPFTPDPEDPAEFHWDDEVQVRTDVDAHPVFRRGGVSMGCAPGSHDDFDPLEHARAVADVANDLRSRGGRVSLPPRRRSRLRDRFLRWVFSVAEDALEDLAERFIEAKMRLNVGAEDLDPWPEPLVPGFGGGRWGTTPFDLEHPEYEEEIPFANREYCGIFGRGGLGR